VRGDGGHRWGIRSVTGGVRSNDNDRAEGVTLNGDHRARSWRHEVKRKARPQASRQEGGCCCNSWTGDAGVGGEP
jgi:hypothetical protein